MKQLFGEYYHSWKGCFLFIQGKEVVSESGSNPRKYKMHVTKRHAYERYVIDNSALWWRNKDSRNVEILWFWNMRKAIFIKSGGILDEIVIFTKGNLLSGAPVSSSPQIDNNHC